MNALATLKNQRLSDAQIQTSLEQTLSKQRPQRDIWIFAYGSLMWNPEVKIEQHALATVEGFHRQFCIWSPEYRGTYDCPGLVLGLERGGSCTGRAFRLPDHNLQEDLFRIWKREMLTGAYHPTWVSANAEGLAIEAITFVVNNEHPQYVFPRLSLEEMAQQINRAAGHRGTCMEYFLETVQCLRECNIHDSQLEELYAMVVDLESN